jgi:hypothetical protein
MQFGESLGKNGKWRAVQNCVQLQAQKCICFECHWCAVFHTTLFPTFPKTLNFLKSYYMFLPTATELYRPSDRPLSTKLVPTMADRGCCVVSATDPHGCNLGFLDQTRCFFFQVDPQLYSRGWVDPVPDTLLLRISVSAWNRTRSQKLWLLDHRGGLILILEVACMR